MKSLSGGLIFRHSRCSELAPTGLSNRSGEDLEHQAACGCTTFPERRSLECSLKKDLLAALTRSLPPRLPLHAPCGVAAVRHQRCLSVDVCLYAKAIDEDIQQPQHGRLPAGLIVHVAHADECAQNVFRADIGAYLAGRDGAVQQGADGFGQALERIDVEFRRALHGKRQRGRHAFFGGNEFDIGSQPAAQGVDRRRLILQLFRQLAELLHLAPIDRLKQGLAGWEVAVKRPDADTGSPCHSFETGVRATGTEDSLRGLQNALAIANRIGTGPPNRFCGTSCHLIILDHDLVRLNWIMISSPCLSMIFSQNQFRFFRIMLWYSRLDKRRMPPYMSISIKRERARRSTWRRDPSLTVAFIGALHESLHRPHRQRCAAGRQTRRPSRHSAGSPA